ncbi:MAG: hypothetical protein KDA89_20905, partial [Planctomycetaceae bacterium]|nr:hypothetical protein [Planctomycetaceae bacterium]
AAGRQSPDTRLGCTVDPLAYNSRISASGRQKCTVLECARRMTWKGEHPDVLELPDIDYLTGIELSKQEMVP